MQATTEAVTTKTKKAKKNTRANGNGASADGAVKPAANQRDNYKPGEVIRLPNIGVKSMQVMVVGTSPLITHKWDEKNKKQMRDKQGGKARMKKPPKDPVAEYNGARYLDEKGRDCVLGDFFKQAMVSSARFLGSEAKMVEIRGAVFVEDDMVPIEYDNMEDGPIMREDTVRVGMGTADLRYRPEYRNWRVPLNITYNSDVYTAEQVLNFLQVAGYGVGICEWRPECNGRYGRFAIAEARAR